MAFIPVPATAQFNVRAQINSVPMENVLHFIREVPGAWDHGDLEAALTVLVAAWTAQMLPVVASGYQAMTCYARDLQTESGAIGEQSFAPASNGDLEGETMPGSVNLCLTHRTNRAGRSYRGRTYIAGLSELSVSGNTINSGAAANILSGFQGVIDLMAASNYTFVIASRYVNNAPRALGVATVVQSTSVRDLVVDTQRRRLR